MSHIIWLFVSFPLIDVLMLYFIQSKVNQSLAYSLFLKSVSILSVYFFQRCKLLISFLKFTQVHFPCKDWNYIEMYGLRCGSPLPPGREHINEVSWHIFFLTECMLLKWSHLPPEVSLQRSVSVPSTSPCGLEHFPVINIKLLGGSFFI